MEKRAMNKLGIETSLLGFGCMRFPLTADGKINEPEAEKMLDKAIASGVNYIDTAYPYHNGESEPFVGKALQKYDRSSLYIATKLPIWQVETLEDIDRIINHQLERLQTDYIDFYLMHAMNKERWDKMLAIGGIQRLEEYKAAGKIKYLGFSFHDEYELFEEMINYKDWDFCQIQLNYMDADIQAGMRGYELTVKKDVPVVIMEPVKGGLLAKFSDDIMAKFRANDPESSAASYAMRWVGSLPNIKVILSGMTTMEQVEDNLKTFTNFQCLSDAEQKLVGEVVDILNSRVQSGCTGCKYCMPCPAGVIIPMNFSAWNKYHIYQDYNVVKNMWNNEIGEAGQAKNCIKCGKCEKECPQKISIRADLEKVQADFDNKIF